MSEQPTQICEECQSPLEACVCDKKEIKEAKEKATIKVETFSEGLKQAITDIKKIVDEKDNVVVSVAGKTGAGKSVFANELREGLEAGGITATVISTDNYILKHKDTDKREHDLSKLTEDVEKSRSDTQVVVIEGLVPTSGQAELKQDYKTHIETNFSQRMARRLMRDEKNSFRTIAESLKLAIKVSVENPGAIKQYEDTNPDNDLDLFVENDYKASGDPKLYMSNNALVFSVDGDVKEKLFLDEDGVQFKALEDIGIDVV